MVLAINWEALKLMGKLGLFVVGFLLAVYLLAVITPWLARIIDKNMANPERVKKGPYDFEKDDLKSIYDIKTDNKENGDDLDNVKQ